LNKKPESVLDSGLYFNKVRGLFCKMAENGLPGIVGDVATLPRPLLVQESS